MELDRGHCCQEQYHNLLITPLLGTLTEGPPAWVQSGQSRRHSKRIAKSLKTKVHAVSQQTVFNEMAVRALMRFGRACTILSHWRVGASARRPRHLYDTGGQQQACTRRGDSPTALAMVSARVMRID